MTGVVVDVQDFGAVGDGATDDTKAIQESIAAAAEIWAVSTDPTAAAEPASVRLIPNSVHVISRMIDLRSNVNVDGDGATLRWLGTSRDRLLLLDGVSNVALKNLTIDAGVTPPLSAIFASNSDRLSFDRLRLTTAVHRQAGIRLSGCTNSSIVDCSVRGFSNAYNIAGPSSNCQIRNSEARGSLSAVLINTVAGAAPSDIDIVGVAVTDLPSGSGFAIRAAGTATAMLRRIRFMGCTVIGPGRSFTDPVRPGSADQINGLYTAGISAIGCTSMYGGDMGMSFTSCTNVTLSENLSAFNNTAGIIAFRSTVVTISGNTCLNNGQNFIGAYRRPFVLFGIGAIGSHDVNILDNALLDDQAMATQNYGVALSGSSARAKDISVGPNAYRGNALSDLYIHRGTTNVANLDAELAANAIGRRATHPSSAPSVVATPGPSPWTKFGGAPTVELPNNGATYRIEVRLNAAIRSVAAAMDLAISADGGATIGKAARLQGATVDPENRAHLTLGNVKASGQTITLWVSGSSRARANLVANHAGGQCELMATRVR